MNPVGENGDPLASAAEHADLSLAPATRLACLKRVIVRAARLVTDRQVAYNRGVIDSIMLLRSRLDEVGGQIADVRGALAGESLSIRAALQSDLSALQLDVTDARARAALVDGQLADIIDTMGGLQDRLNEAHDELELLRREQESARRPERVHDSRAGRAGDLHETLRTASTGSFEERKERLAVYVAEVAGVAADGPVVDLGTGRGEWLELLREAGIEAYGVDADAWAVEQCRIRDLQVAQADALEHLAALPDASVAVLSAFRLAEHLELDALVELFDRAKRVLAPGGLLLIESPNQERLAGGAGSEDSIRSRLPHAKVLQLVLSAKGFEDVRIRYVDRPEPWQLTPELRDGVPGLQPLVDQINELLPGAQGFAVLARVAP